MPDKPDDIFGTSYVSEADYKEKDATRSEIAAYWQNNWAAADRVYKQWAQRFQVNILYQYYEGYQWISDTDWVNRPYVVNMIYANIQSKLPNLVFENPEYSIRPKPIGMEFNFEESAKRATAKEDVLNYVCTRKEFGLNDKHELAVLDAFFGFGILDISLRDSTNSKKYKNPLDDLECKHVPFDRFRVSAQSNWDLSEGRWCGYYEFVPTEDLDKYKEKLNFDKQSSLTSDDSEAAQIAISGKITIGESTEEFAPLGTIKILNIWDFRNDKYIKLALDNATMGDRLLEYKTFDSCGICSLRFDKRRKGWYPHPPVFQWLCPQDEINDIRQTHKVHRKRYTRKYAIVGDSVEQEELDKFLYGPDGTCFKVNRPDAIVPIIDAPLDTANQQSLILSYDDFLRVSGGNTEQGRVADRTTATQAKINSQLSQIRESKDMIHVGNFMVEVGKNILVSLKSVKGEFWATISKQNENIMGELQILRNSWKRVPPQLFDEEDHDISVKINSISPVYQQEDKRNFMEFLAMITQYEILAFSPGLLREAAYRVGYKNETVLNQFMQLAQLAAIGRQQQLKGQVQAMQSPPGAQPGQLAEQQNQESTPPDNQEIMNTIFNRGGLQPGATQ